jgi:hypothetical protein
MIALGYPVTNRDHENPGEAQRERRAWRPEAERQLPRSSVRQRPDLRRPVLVLEREVRWRLHALSGGIVEPLSRVNHWRPERLSQNGTGP